VCHTININLRVNGEFCTICRGDGVICATPTGSTGYSLSAGSAVIDPSLEAIVVTPTCLQLACLRSMVLEADSQLSFLLNSDRSTSLFWGGEESIPIMKGDEFLVQRAQVMAKIIQFNALSQCTKLYRLSNSNNISPGCQEGKTGMVGITNTKITVVNVINCELIIL